MATNETIEKKYGIDTTDLQVGQVFKNKRELCKYLNQDYISNKTASTPQVNEWKRYIDWEKDGQKIIITEIYPTPLDKADGRVANGTQVYQKFIEDILLAYFDSVLSYSEENMDNTDPSGVLKIQLTLNQIMLICGMVNEKYIDKNIKNILVDMDYSIFNVNDFFSRTKSKFRTIIDNALAHMYKCRIINYSKDLIIIDKCKHRTATEDEEDLITNVEKKVLRDMGYESIVNVFLSYRTEEYNHRVDKYLKDEYNWDGAYRVYSIRVNRLRINIEKDYLMSTNQQNKLELNKKLTTFFNKQVKNKVIKSNNNDLGGFKLPSNYKSQQASLTDYLLN